MGKVGEVPNSFYLVSLTLIEFLSLCLLSVRIAAGSVEIARTVSAVTSTATSSAAHRTFGTRASCFTLALPTFTGTLFRMVFAACKIR